MVKIGDKVRFLNAVGGGVVTKIQKNLVFVADEDGFETPVLATEIVVVNAVNAYNFPTENAEPAAAEIATEPAQTPAQTYTFDPKDETEKGKNLYIYLAFVPEDDRQIQTTKMDCYLVNESNYYLFFNYLRGEKELKIKETDTIEPQTTLWLEKVDKEALNQLANIRLQAIAYKKDGIFEPKPTIDSEIKVDLVKFYKLHSFVDNDFFDKKAWILPIVENDTLPQSYQISSDKLQKIIAEKERNSAPQAAQKPKQKAAEIIEIDLHINQLLDNTSGMSRHEMLEFQMNKFHETMRANLRKKGQKIVFIHGKGDGVLRKAIEKELKNSYRSCYFQDASFQQYGFGATQVTIR